MQNNVKIGPLTGGNRSLGSAIRNHLHVAPDAKVSVDTGFERLYWVIIGHFSRTSFDEILWVRPVNFASSFG